MTFTDSARNRLAVERTGRSHLGDELLVCRVEGDPGTGYVAADDGAGRFGDDECPDGPPVCGWFGPGQRWLSPKHALDEIGND